MKFLVENNLSKLGKWLRFLGYDVEVLEGPINYKDLLRARDRVFITTSRRWEKTLKNLGIDYLVVPRHDWELQLSMVVKKFGLNGELKLNLCPYCGTELTPIRKEDFKDRIPTKAYETATDFTLCPSCGHIFWKGKHYERMVETIRKILKNL